MVLDGTVTFPKYYKILSYNLPPADGQSAWDACGTSHHMRHRRAIGGLYGFEPWISLSYL